MARVVTPDQLQELLKSMPAEVKEAVNRGIKSAALRGQGFAVEEIDQAKPHPAVNTGELRQSVKVEHFDDGSEIVAGAPHAAIIEYGTRAFWPPLAPLILWAARKFSVDEGEATKIANAVRVAISRRGIAPRGYMKKALERTKKILMAEVLEELKGIK